MRNEKAIAFAFLAVVCVPLMASGYGVEGEPGLRAAEQDGPDKIVLTFGPSFYSKQAAEHPEMFQVVSATDGNFQLGVPASGVKVGAPKDDARYPDGYAGPRFETTTVEITLPRAMKDGHRYWMRVNSRWITAANKRARWIEQKGKTPQDLQDPRYGIRELRILTPQALHVMTGAGIDVRALNDTETMSVISADDPDFKEPVHPVQVGRRSNLDFYIPAGWPWRYHQRHELFLVFKKTFKNGKSYEVNINAKPDKPVTCGVAKSTLAFSDASSTNLAIKVNQCGYLPDAPEKSAYIGMWMGDLNACDFTPFAARFEVRDARTRKVVLAGNADPVRKATYKLVAGKLEPDPGQVKGPETVYKVDLSYENVTRLDLSPLNTPGTYYVCVPGMGRSMTFRVDKDIYSEPFKALMNGLLHQRCGIELKEPLTKHYRSACHRNSTEYSTFRNGVDKDPFRNLPKTASDGKKHDIWGGHHDAGDWNPRAHMEVAEALFLLYELNPGAFTDGQLNIPERGNSIPDVLDEALWALNLWVRLQDEDGGVHGGIESNGDPVDGDEAATDRLREFAFARDTAASYRFAAAAAQASIILGGLGEKKEAGLWLERSLKAWKWAETNGGEKENDQHAFAAAMLLRSTGEEAYGRSFEKNSVFSGDIRAPVLKWDKYDQMYASFYYCLAAKAKPEMKENIVLSFERSFRDWERSAETTAYRFMKEPYAPCTWGSGGLPVWLRLPAMTMRVTGDEELKSSCRRWIILTDDFSLGCNPMNLVFTVGLGQRYVTTAWHHLMENSPAGIIPGLQSEGPGGRYTAGQDPGGGGMGNWPGMSLYPPGAWPELYKFSENASPGANEGITVNQVYSAFAYGLLCPPIGHGQ